MYSPFKRILIIGCCGAGKSTFARKLHQQLGLELIHLDQLYWQPNWIEPDKKTWHKILNKVIQKEEWIMDGNYGSSMDLRINRADTIVYLDYPTRVCFFRVLKRIWKHHGQVRPDMPAGCKERFDLNFLHYVLVFNLIRRKAILDKLAKATPTKTVVYFKNDQEANHFLSKLDPLSSN